MELVQPCQNNGGYQVLNSPLFQQGCTSCVASLMPRQLAAKL